MTFTSTIENNGISELFGRVRFVSGNIQKTTSAGNGTIETGLNRVIAFYVQPHAESNTTPSSVYPRVADFPVQSGNIPVRAAGAVKAKWFALGE
jgi:hypothetical protein